MSTLCAKMYFENGYKIKISCTFYVNKIASDRQLISGAIYVCLGSHWHKLSYIMKHQKTCQLPLIATSKLTALI